MLQNAYLDAKIGFDTEENEPVSPIISRRSRSDASDFAKKLIEST